MALTAEEKADLKKSFKEVVEEGVNPTKAELKTAQDELKTTKDKLTAVETELGKIKSLPIVQRGPTYIPDLNKKVYGHKIAKCGTSRLTLLGKSLRQEIADNKHQFETFSDDESLEKYAEFMLTFIEARCKNNPTAMQKLYEMQQKAAYAEGGATTGQTLVPIEYQWDMIQLARNFTFALNECQVWPMSRDQLQLPREASMVSVGWKGEAIAADQGEGTFDSVTLNAEKLTALAISSNELISDSALDLVGILTEQFSYAVNLELDKQVLAGTGSPVSGLMKGTAGVSIVLATGSAHFSKLIGDNYSDAISRLPDGYLNNAKWVLHRSLKHYVRTMKDNNGAYIFQSPAGAQPGTIWEYPYIISENATTTAASTVAAVFGNLRRFYIGRRLGEMTLDVDPYGKFPEYQTRFRIVTRWGFAMALAAAFVSIVTSAS